MMTSKLLLIATACLLAVPSWAIVCLPNICDTVRCRNDITAENCNGVFKENGGFCGCCPLCVTIIPAGGSCLNIRGVPATAECEQGTRCLNGTCQQY